MHTLPPAPTRRPAPADGPGTVTPRRRRSSAGRLLAAVVGLVVGIVALGLGASPASAAPPGAPAIVGAVAYDEPGPYGLHRLTFAPAAGSGTITKYDVERWNQAKTEKNGGGGVGGSPGFDPGMGIGGAQDGVTHQYRVRAQNADGWGPWSPFTAITTVVGKGHHQPFGTETQMIQRQLDDFGVGGPIGFWPAFVDDSYSTGSFLHDLATHPKRANRAKVIRLYLAYFDRAPEPAGLDYWQDRLDAGTATLSNASSFFAASNEFKAIYGNTNDTQFVTLVYQNVLFRQPAPNEVAYWTGSLAQGTTTRGKLMIGFSESAEGKDLRKGDAVVADLWATMLRTPAKDADIARYSPYIEAGGRAGGLALVVLTLPGYTLVMG